MRQDTTRTPPGTVPSASNEPAPATVQRPTEPRTAEQRTAEQRTAEQQTAVPAPEPRKVESRTLATAQLKAASAKSETSGTATFSGDDAALTKVMIDVKGAPKGTYEVHVLDGSDCAAIAGMETPYAGGPGVAGEGKIGTPGPATTMALWQSLGTMTVDETGVGKIAVDVKNAEGAKLDQRVVVIYPEKSAAQGKKQAIIACGPVKTEMRAVEGAG